MSEDTSTSADEFGVATEVSEKLVITEETRYAVAD
jgi:hypothetical protein